MNIPLLCGGSGMRRPSTRPSASPTQKTARMKSENHTRVRLSGIRVSSRRRGTREDGFEQRIPGR
jgi:hypothetical protein